MSRTPEATRPRCTNNCGKHARAWYCLVHGDEAEPEFEACSQACAEEWVRFCNMWSRFPRGFKVEKLEDL